jgi:predicted ribosome quality control (RQC) complex YloA/Tae2 family protein
MPATYAHDAGVSNAIRYDSLLVRELARELNARLAGARLDGAYFDRERLRLTLYPRPARRGGGEPPALLWQLHPDSGHLTAAPPGAGAGRAQLPPRARITGVSAPPDERLILIDVTGDDAPGTVRRIIVELVTNQWNALATAADHRIVAVLRERETGARVLRAGEVYAPPRPTGRPGRTRALPLDEWVAALSAVPTGERLRALPRLVAFISPQNAGWIMGATDATAAAAALERAWQRYRALVWSGTLRPVLRRQGGAWQPYVQPLAMADDAPDSAGDVEPSESLLHAFASAAERAAAAPSQAEDVEDALAAVAERIAAVDRRIRRLREEQEGAAGEGTRLRARADLLLAQLHTVARGVDRVLLDDFAGGAVEVELDPALNPADNAARLYDAARRRDRAAARMPALLEAAGRERHRLEALAGRIRDGTAGSDELARLRARRGGRAAAGRDAPPPLPYRRYRTTGGLEVRVGRGSRANDALTFRHSSPNDVWLHARDAAGAHVILRWQRADANPPAKDIAEAAVLAALHSRARTAGTVPVDWTRRKYVRKPRKAGPGRVVPERVRTVFVEPDPRLEQQLREDLAG